MLLSDGEENESPYIDDVKDDIVSAGVIVDVIAFTQDASKKIHELAVLTGMMPTAAQAGQGGSTMTVSSPDHVKKWT